MKKPVVITIISLVLLALISGGVVWYLKQRKQTVNVPVTENNSPEKQQVNNNEPTKSEEQNASSTTENVDISGWLTYWNEEYGFEVKYPNEFIYVKRPTIEEALFLTFNPKNNTDNEIFITLLSLTLQEHHKIAMEAQLETESCLGSKDSCTCYVYRKEDNRFLRNDIIVKNNKKYNFNIFIHGIPNLSSELSINSFLQNEFNPQDQYLVNILEQIKKSTVFF